MAKKKENVVVEEPRVRMGSDLLDLLIGGDKNVYGLPFGAIIQIWGDSSAGKTFIKNEMIASTYWAMGGPKAKLVWESDDSETGDTFKTERLYGVNIHPEVRKIGPLKFEDSETVEEMDGKLTNMLNWMPEDMYGIYAVDSLDGLADKTKKEKEAKRAKQQAKGEEVKDDGDYGAQIAKFLSQDFFRNKHKALERKKLTLIIVSQTRCNFGAVGAFAPKKKTGNGDAMEFYCHTRLKLSRLAFIEREGTKVGVVVKAVTTKSKTPRPFREIVYTAYFDYGIDNIGSNIDYLFDLRGDDGKLGKAANAIAWSANAKKKSLTNLKDWLKKMDWERDCKADLKAACDGKSNLSVDWIIGWATEDPERKIAFDEEFGEEFTRDELIKLCEDNPEMAKELTERVRAKWEEHEDAVATKRPAKYGNNYAVQAANEPTDEPTEEPAEATA
ncbi:MAG: hypothetical protein IKT27_05870 [Clostridia bacterium]|nr:hypothetical protein [Clostridia bacterium]